MGIPDDGRNFPDDAAVSLGGGKDLLYGWLVGRAAADLGLAQALATSETQRNEQLRRLEESLLGQIRALQNCASTDSGKSAAEELDALKVELQRVSEGQQQLSAQRVHVEQLEAAIRDKLQQFESHIQGQTQSGGDSGDVKFDLNLLTDRIARAEHAVQQAQARAANQQQQIEEIVADRLKMETALLKSQLLAELESRTPAATIAQSVEERVRKELDELSALLRQAAGATNELAAMRDRLAQLFERLGRLEAAPNASASLAEQESRWSGEWNERLARLEQAALGGLADSKAEIGAIKNRLDDVAKAAPADGHALRRLDESVAARLAMLEEKLGAALDTIKRRDAESAGLNEQWSTVGGQLAEFSQLWKTQAAHTQALESRLGEGLEAAEQRGADLSQVQINLSALLNRITQLELSYQQVQSMSGADAQRAELIAEALRAEVETLKTDLSQQAMVTAQSVMAPVEEHIGAKLNEIGGYLLRVQQDGEARDQRFSEMQGELHLIAQRLVQAESSAQQTHALMVTETAQSAQSRDGVMSELAALQSRLADQLARNAGVDVLAQELSGRIEDLQNQLSRSIAMVERRDEEIAELKAQVENLSRSTIPKSTTALAPSNRAQAPLAVTVGLAGVKGQTEPIIPALKSSTNAPNTLLQSYDAEAGGAKEQKKQLQQRISADIERVRAELRKRAGVSR